MKKEAMNQDKLFVNHLSGKGLESKIDKILETQ